MFTSIKSHKLGSKLLIRWLEIFNVQCALANFSLEIFPQWLTRSPGLRWAAPSGLGVVKPLAFTK